MAKIIIVGPAYPYRGGQSLVEAYLHKTITALGYDALTVSYSLLYPSIFFPGTTQYDTSKIIPFEHTSKIYRLINSINPITWIKAYRFIKKESPDIVIFVWWMPFFGPAIWSIAKRLRKKCQSTRLTFLVENYISHENRWFDEFFTKKTLKLAHSFICQSNYIEKQITHDFPATPIHRTTLSIYDCYNLNQYSKQTAREFLHIHSENVILFFGLIRPYKGLDRLIETFAQLLESKPDTTLLIVGENYEGIEKYQHLIEKYALQSRVILVNKFIDNEDVEPYFKATDAVIMPYYSGTQSGILMMSYGFERPVVVTEVGGIAELVIPNETGIVVKNNEVENLLPSIIKILDTKEQIPYSDNIRKYIHKLGYVNMANILEEIIK
ncbi:MAG: glycosyltransferase [Bacteroidales bacterium]|jgi:glycosyltransferase involved in cell wall biosynthesis|nr:glycosyltransferase [Bacteroidales bacterium]